MKTQTPFWFYFRFRAIFLLLIFFGLVTSVNGTNSWSSKKKFGGGGRVSGVGFMIGEKAYIGTGLTDGYATLDMNWSKDFWEWDPSTNVWTQKADFGGGERVYAVGFSIGNKGYVGTGYYYYNSQNDFWEYDPSSNKWAQKTKYPGGAVKKAVGFSIGNKGYVGTGMGTSSYKTDFYEYDPSSDSWSQLADFAGGARYNATGFGMGTKGYLGTGINGSTAYKDFWEYDPSDDTWTQKADVGNTIRVNAVGFSIGSRGYIATGIVSGSSAGSSDLYEYDAVLDKWTKKTSYGDVTFGAVGFSSCTHGYIGTGVDYYNSPDGFSDFMEYTPSIPLQADFYPRKTNFCLGDCVAFSDSSTNGPTNWSWTFNGGSVLSSTDQNPGTVCFDTAGTYTITLIASNPRCTSTITRTITVNPLPGIGVTPTSATICEGKSVTITANGGNTYGWSPSSGLNAITGRVVIASPTSSSEYTVTGTSTAGCSATASVVITVNPKPTIVVNPSTKEICPGESVSISTSGASTYSWFPSSDLSSATNPTITATPLQTTTYTVTGTDDNGCVNTGTSVITVDPIPNANAGSNVSICPGDDAQLHATGGVSYSWSPSTGLSCTNCANPMAAPSATTQYTVTVTNANGCTNTASVTVTVKGALVANAGTDASICQGDTTSLSASGGTGYSWMPSTGLSNPNTQNPKAYPTTTTTYTVTVTSGKCTPSSDEVVVVVNPLPPTPTITQSHNDLSSSPAKKYQWYHGSQKLTGATGQVYSATESGFYIVCISDALGCESCSDVFQFSGIPGIQPQEDFEIYPNPSHGQFTLKFAAQEVKTHVLLIDLVGREIQNFDVRGDKAEINLTSNPKGTYMLEVKNERGNMNKRIIIE